MSQALVERSVSVSFIIGTSAEETWGLFSFFFSYIIFKNIFNQIQIVP